MRHALRRRYGHAKPPAPTRVSVRYREAAPLVKPGYLITGGRGNRILVKTRAGADRVAGALRAYYAGQITAAEREQEVDDVFDDEAGR